MNLCLIGHDFRYELEKLVRIFLPFEKIQFYNTENTASLFAVTEISEEQGNLLARAELHIAGKIFKKSMIVDMRAADQKKEEELKLALCLYDCFVKATGYIPQWGILTGVRPAKLFSRLSAEVGKAKAEEYFKNILMVSGKKLNLCRQTTSKEESIIKLSTPDSFSLYISVPFCPSRCSYCSFVSHSVENAGKLIPEYVDCLCREIEQTGKTAAKLGLKLETVYIGGGTPTTLSAGQLTRITDTVKSSFDISALREYTVEAGRPDTITDDKLAAIKEGGATRISINPQTMNNAVLETIGRKHTAGQVCDTFELARRLGFDNINMDLIAGLPSDTFDSFKDTLHKIIELDPESITVHALAMKRSSNLSMNNLLPQIETGKTASDMVDFAHDLLCGCGYSPYYMYRQSKTVGNLENVGYSKNGFECLYNVFIMDETHTILACGASGVTKLRRYGENYIERIFNFKYPYEYISRFGEITVRKDGIIKFYQNNQEV